MDVPTSDHVPLLMKLGLLGGKSTHEKETEWEMTKYKTNWSSFTQISETRLPGLEDKFNAASNAASQNQ